MNSEFELTMTAMLGDPLIQLMRQSDGVSEEAHAALLYRVRATLNARHGSQPMPERLVSVH